MHFKLTIRHSGLLNAIQIATHDANKINKINFISFILNNSFKSFETDLLTAIEQLLRVLWIRIVKYFLQ